MEQGTPDLSFPSFGALRGQSRRPQRFMNLCQTQTQTKSGRRDPNVARNDGPFDASCLADSARRPFEYIHFACFRYGHFGGYSQRNIPACMWALIRFKMFGSL
ncbi:uncharacterized protein LAESUDRAFT_572259 [Laetiporus sulphureus 93-53]|uniref:Uncharacterized protein n=1 Tax=Laetiporus sulphureus 93-53 TaxID=1314785 RepID=A0A165FJL2_9APHY|nr:uncharacterized protein LAESUDRAFT_572259 [Laetiporus sulphureus 93-53]KZT09071.1 hypothetical protein LAESUDRAFT_572259 [Laetiporus sulphureus 93-53]